MEKSMSNEVLVSGAKKIDDVRVVAGRLIRVVNQKRKKFSNAKKQYFALWVEDANGKNERCLLLTDREVAALEYRASRNREDLPKKGRITDLLD
jgi:hypothetical protein